MVIRKYKNYDNRWFGKIKVNGDSNQKKYDQW